MPQLFLAMRTRGPAWNDGVTMDEQVDWRAHADFMNDLRACGIALLTEDCWSVQGLLQTLWIKPWWLRLGTLHP